jgi:hypothetical protein
MLIDDVIDKQTKPTFLMSCTGAESEKRVDFYAFKHADNNLEHDAEQNTKSTGDYLQASGR